MGINLKGFDGFMTISNLKGILKVRGNESGGTEMKINSW